MKKITDIYGRERYIEEIDDLDSCIIKDTKRNNREDLLDDNAQSWKQPY